MEERTKKRKERELVETIQVSFFKTFMNSISVFITGGGVPTGIHKGLQSILVLLSIKKYSPFLIYANFLEEPPLLLTNRHFLKTSHLRHSYLPLSHRTLTGPNDTQHGGAVVSTAAPTKKGHISPVID